MILTKLALIPGRVYVVAALAVMLFGMGWKVRDWSADSQLSAVQQQHAEAVTKAAQELNTLTDQYRATERALQAEINGVSDALTYQLMQTETDLSLALATARTDAGRLRIENARCAARLPGTASVTPAPSSNDDPTPRRVIPEPDTTLDILRIAGEADRVAARLRACQSYVVQVVERAL